MIEPKPSPPLFETRLSPSKDELGHELVRINIKFRRLGRQGFRERYAVRERRKSGPDRHSAAPRSKGLSPELQST